MSGYTGTKAQSGLGSTIAIGSTPVTIGEIQSLKQSGAKWDTEDATNLASAAKEFVATILDWGEFSVEAKRVSTDAGQIAVQAAFLSGAATPFVITLAKESGQMTSGDKLTFNAVVTECDLEISTSKLTTYNFKLKVSNGITFTEGA